MTIYFAQTNVFKKKVVRSLEGMALKPFYGEVSHPLLCAGSRGACGKYNSKW